jgi:hypothetical protein
VPTGDARRQAETGIAAYVRFLLTCASYRCGERSNRNPSIDSSTRWPSSSRLNRSDTSLLANPLQAEAHTHRCPPNRLEYQQFR